MGYSWVAMTRRAEELLHAALSLDVKERAALAAELMASVDGEPEADVEAAWAEEIQRREERALAGQTQFQNWDDVQALLERKYPKRTAE